ncbi:MAG: hypothetical protein KAW02_05570 [candidate division Zixibacteria bacterium]|nr:hypothetical protein [candidate division Zixibacteria bacterium]
MAKYYEAGDAIAGKRIAAWFRGMDLKSEIDKGVLGSRCFRAKLRGNVFCVIEKCLALSVIRSLKKPNIHLSRGDSLKAKQIMTEFGKMRRQSLVQGSSSHRIRTTTFEDKVYCVIDMPFEAVKNQ